MIEVINKTDTADDGLTWRTEELATSLFADIKRAVGAVMMDNVIEPVPIDDVFCTELVKVARVGPCLRLIFATPEALLDNSECKVIVARLIIPAEEAETGGFSYMSEK